MSYTWRRLQRLGLLLALQSWLLIGGLAGTPASADNSLQTARDLGRDIFQVTVTDNIGARDMFDWYRFRMTETRIVTVGISGLTVDADLSLIDARGGTIVRSPAKKFHALREELGPGTYYVQLSASAGSSAYQLDLRTFYPVRGGRTQELGTLDGMGGLNGTRVVNGSLDARTGIGWVDHWFTLPDYRNVRIQAQTSPQTGGALFNANSEPIGVLQNGRLDRGLGAGRYFVRVFGNQQTIVNYNLRVEAQVPDTGDTAGNIPALARDLGSPGNPPLVVNEFVGDYDFDDYYRVTVPAGKKLNIQLGPTDDDANAWLYNAQGALLFQSTSPGRGAEIFSWDAPQGGVFLIRVGIARRLTPNERHNTRYQLFVGTTVIGSKRR